jgi:hypothetical protein
MVSTEELDVLHAHDTRSLVLFLETLESCIRCCARRGLPVEWLIDDEQRVGVIKSELGLRGAFELKGRTLKAIWRRPFLGSGNRTNQPDQTVEALRVRRLKHSGYLRPAQPAIRSHGKGAFG